MVGTFKYIPRPFHKNYFKMRNSMTFTGLHGEMLAISLKNNQFSLFCNLALQGIEEKMEILLALQLRKESHQLED